MDYNYEIDLVEGEEGDIPIFSESFRHLEGALDKAIFLIEKGKNTQHCVILSTETGATLFTLRRYSGMAIIVTNIN